jgi:hypothetical protein|tara:strand:- start:204 stop:437 length:234 start_codon:yes stop_codon:yes gene_type:complete
MNEITVFVYLVFFVALFGMTFAFMFKMMGSVLSDIDRKPVNSYGDAMRAYKPHPEMKDVKDGDELLVFKSLEDLEDK